MVKLQIYQIEGEKTYVDSFEAESFDDFIIIVGDFDHKDSDELQNIYESISEKTNKTVLMIDNKADIKFLGLKEDIDDES